MNEYPLYDMEYYETYRDCITGIAEKYGDNNAITSYDKKGNPHVRSFVQLKNDAERFGKTLHNRGIVRQNIAIAAENSYEWLVAFFGITLSGNVAVMVDIEQSADTIKKMTAHTDCVLVVASSLVSELFGMEYTLPIITVGKTFRLGDEEFWSFCDDSANSSDDFFYKINISGDDTAAIVFTSGTVSTSKPVMLSHKGMIANAVESVRMVDVGTHIYTSLPLFHTYGFTCSTLNMLIRGSSVCINGELKTMLRDLKLFNPTTIMVVPLIAEMLQKLLHNATDKDFDSDKQPQKAKNIFHFWRKKPISESSAHEECPELVEIKKSVLGNVNLIISGGAHLHPDIIKDFSKYGIIVVQGYGITECSPLVCVNRNKANRPGSVGQPLPSMELKFVEEEIFVRGISVMQGYYKDEALTDEAFDREWFKTGDLGYCDKDGFLYITGRSKNLIVLKNGKKITPEEIEAKVQQLPLVGEVIAYGAASGDSADDVRLAVMIYPDQKASEGMSAYEILEVLQADIDRINESNPVYKQIQMVNLRENEFEKTAAKKIKRQLV